MPYNRRNARRTKPKPVPKNVKAPADEDEEPTKNDEEEHEEEKEVKEKTDTSKNDSDEEEGHNSKGDGDEKEGHTDNSAGVTTTTTTTTSAPAPDAEVHNWQTVRPRTPPPREIEEMRKEIAELKELVAKQAASPAKLSSAKNTPIRGKRRQREEESDTEASKEKHKKARNSKKSDEEEEAEEEEEEEEEEKEKEDEEELKESKKARKARKAKKKEKGKKKIKVSSSDSEEYVASPLTVELPEPEGDWKSEGMEFDDTFWNNRLRALVGSAQYDAIPRDEIIENLEWVHQERWPLWRSLPPTNVTASASLGKGLITPENYENNAIPLYGDQCWDGSSNKSIILKMPVDRWTDHKYFWIGLLTQWALTALRSDTKADNVYHIHGNAITLYLMLLSIVPSFFYDPALLVRFGCGFVRCNHLFFAARHTSPTTIGHTLTHLQNLHLVKKINYTQPGGGGTGTLVLCVRLIVHSPNFVHDDLPPRAPTKRIRA